MWLSLIMASLNIITELNKCEKLNDENYNVQQLKMHYVLEEQKVLEAIHNTMDDLSEDTNAQNKIDQEAY